MCFGLVGVGWREEGLSRGGDRDADCFPFKLGCAITLHDQYVPGTYYMQGHTVYIFLRITN